LYYTVYRITNKINGKYYIGKHQTSDLNDGYMGSGLLIRRALNKYGLENFEKDILFIFETEAEMNDKEKELVVISENTYNLCEGGHGGFGFINRNGLANRDTNIGKLHAKRMKTDLVYRQKMTAIACQNFKKAREEGRVPRPDYFKGKKHTEETKRKIGAVTSAAMSGSGNSQYGTFWITNGIENMKCRGDIPAGFYRGRKC
jgi:hypothetical protein